MTKTKSTHTALGEIPHLKYMGILCPVKLAKNEEGRISNPSVPMTHNGKYVYALPGGLEVER